MNISANLHDMESREVETLDVDLTDSSGCQILCCQCGTPIESNPSNTCLSCLSTRIDITEGLPKQSLLHFCKGCERYLLPPSAWVSCSLESKELLRICLSRLKGLSKVHVIDAGFIWTEPHSKRIKVKLTIQKEVLGSTILQQVFVVEYIVQHQMCEDCHRREAQDFWRAVVQVRQKVSHRRTFIYLEQLILKYHIHDGALKIKECHNGLDFYYSTKSAARKMVEFLTVHVPCRMKTSQQLVSHDIHNNKYQYKHTFSIEITPISKNDLVCLPLKLAQSLGGINQIVLCTRVTSFLQFVDPTTLEVAELSGNSYWKMPFNSLCDCRNLTEFYILHIEKSDHDCGKKVKGVLSDTWVVPLSDLGHENKQLHCRTNLGHILKVGDTALGFNFKSANLNDSNFDLMKTSDIPDVILVKKSYGDKVKRHKLRNWKLQELDKEMEVVPKANYDRDYAEFLETLEEDESFRKDVNIYFDPSVNQVSSDDVPPDVPQISLEEMLHDMTIQDNQSDNL